MVLSGSIRLLRSLQGGDCAVYLVVDRARGSIVGSEKYLTKPFSKEDLINAITTHVS